MIKHLMPGSGIHIKDETVPPYISPGAQSAGPIRYNSSLRDTEVYDGISWLRLCSNVNVELTDDVQQVLVAWARVKMQEEKKLEQLMIKHVGLRDLHEKFELMKTLCQTDEENAAR